MKFLIDHSVSRLTAEELKKEGHDAAHISELGLGCESDRTILERAVREGRTLVTADTRHAWLLPEMGRQAPSVILIAATVGHRPRERAVQILRWLPSMAAALHRGSMVVMEQLRIRVWKLPLLLRCTASA